MLDRSAYLDAFHRASGGIGVVLDFASRRWVHLDPAIEGLLGYTPEEILAAGPGFITSRVHPEDLPALQAGLAAALEALQAGRADLPQLVLRLKTRGGDYRWVQAQGTPLEATRAVGILTDITRFRALEASLRASEGRFRAVVENSWDVISVFNDQGKLVYNSPAAERIHGLRSEDLIGKATFEFIHPEDVAPVAVAFQKILEDPSTPQTIQYRYVRRGGGWVWMEATGANFLEDPDIQGIVAVSREITERKLAEEALQRTQALLQESQDLAGLGSFEVDLAARTTRWSPTLFRLLNVEPGPEPPRLRDLLKGLETAERQALVAAFRRTLGAGQPLEGEVRVRLGEGGFRHLAFRGRLEGGVGQGRSRRLIGAVLDVSERKVHEQEIQESLARFKELADLLPQTIYEMDLTGRLTFVNRCAMTTFGYSEAEVAQGVTGLQMLVPEDRERAQANLMRVLGGGSSGHQYTALRRDGTTFPVVMHSTRIMAGGRPVGLRGLIVDLTDLARAQEDRDRLQERLRQAEKMEAIGQLAGGVAHDFNNQLGAILGFAELLVDGVADASLRRFAENIVLACQRSADLTRQLLAFARRGQLTSEAVDLSQMVREVVSLLGHSLDKRIEVRVDLPPEPAWVRGDASQLQSALMNLAVNARDAMPTGGVLQFRTRRVRLDEAACAKLSGDLHPGEHIEVEVTDSGVGIPAEVLDRIFEPFFTTKEQGKGTGLGLASVFGTAKAHGGAISVESLPGRGSTFTLRLPSTPGPEAREGDPERRDEAAEARRILIVEDEPLVGEMLGDMLRRLGYRAELHTHPRVALAVFEANPKAWDLVILDLVMPEMSGREVFDTLQAIHPGVRVLVSSGYSLEGEAQRILERGAQGFIQKPYRLATLSLAVADALKGGRGQSG